MNLSTANCRTRLTGPSFTCVTWPGSPFCFYPILLHPKQQQTLSLSFFTLVHLPQVELFPIHLFICDAIFFPRLSIRNCVGAILDLFLLLNGYFIAQAKLTIAFTCFILFSFFFLLPILDSTACQLNEFRCTRDGRCIDENKKCDHWDDCGDNSDEKDCDFPPCHEGQFRCSNAICIPQRWKCDGHADCTDHSDEANCSK